MPGIKSRFVNPAMKELADQQVRYAPYHVRLQQIERAEELLAEVDAETSCPYREVCRRITGFRPERYPDLTLQGEEALHDLRCFVEALSDSIDLPVENAPEPVLTVEDVSQRYNVSTKTVNRWRNRGLVSRRFRFGRRKRVGFLQSSVERFVQRNASEVHRGTQFSQLDAPEREEMIRRARRLARFGGGPSEISHRLARKFDRSPETIRYTLKNYDREHPETAVFPEAGDPLTEEQKNEIFRKYRRGVSAERLAAHYHRTRASIYRIVSEIRAWRLIEQPIDYMPSPEFEADDAEEVILGPPPNPEKKSPTSKPPGGLPPYLASLYAIPVLTREEEVYHFRKMNYLKFRAARLRGQIDPARPRSRPMDEIERLLDQSMEIKNFLIRSNLRLVVSVAKRHLRPGTNFFEMVSDGNMSLIRAIEKFDYTKGNKFSTYATWAIMKNFARSIPAEHVLLDRFRTGTEEIFAQSSDNRGNQFEEEMVNQQQRQLLMGILDHLDERERDVIRFRYGLERGLEPQTLEQVGNRFGVTKERVRQLESRALHKLRRIADHKQLEVPGL